MIPGAASGPQPVLPRTHGGRYSAIAVGCIPVILCDRLREKDMPYPTRVPWAELWVKGSDAAFVRDPSSLVRRLRALNSSVVRHKQRLLARHRLDVLYEEPGSRAGTNFVLDAASRCLPPALPNRTVVAPGHRDQPTLRTSALGE